MKKLLEAYNKFHEKMPKLKKNAKNPHFNSDYVDLPGLLDAIQKPLKEAGLTIFQSTKIEGVFILLKTRVFIAEEEELLSEYPIHIDKNPQKTGSALTYARRYSILTILGLAADDDDGNKASKIEAKYPEKIDTVMLRRIEEAGGWQKISQFAEYKKYPPIKTWRPEQLKKMLDAILETSDELGREYKDFRGRN
jgi:hypothetical protein